MRGLVNNLFKSFGSKKKLESTTNGERKLPLRDIERDDIPRYPPFIRGFPCVPVINLLEMQAQLIDEIRASLGMGHESFNEHLLPVIENVAAFVHLLPASEAHHHKGAGGLFRHALEASLYSAKASKGPVFAVDGSPKFRRDTEPLWRLACAIAGLLHDIGKPLTDMTVTNKAGTLIWNSHIHPTVHEWLTANNIDRYFLTWNSNRHQEHESAAHLVFNDLVPRQVRAYLSTPDPRVLKQLSDAVLIQSRIGNKVAEMMSLGDRTSVANDMRNNNLDMDQFAHGIPIERYVFDAIRRLVNSGTWKVNEQGGKVFHTHTGTFIAWKGLGDLYALLDRDKIPGIPRDPATLADIMIDGGFCEPQIIKVGEEEHRRRYWDVRPECLTITMEMLRFNSHTYVFTSEPPSAIHCEVEEYETGQQSQEQQSDDTEESTVVINEQTGEILNHAGQSHNQEQVSHTSTDAESAPEPETVEPVVQKEQGAEQKKAQSVLDSVGVGSALSMFKSQEPQAEPEPEPEPEPQAKKPQNEIASKDKVQVKPEPKPEPAQQQPEPNKPAVETSSKDKNVASTKLAKEKKKETVATEEKHKDPTNKNKASKTYTHDHNHDQPVQADSRAKLDKLLKDYPESDKIIRSLLEPDKATVLAQSGTQLVIPFPAGIQRLGEQDKIMPALRKDKAINVDPVMPGVGAMRVGGQSCVVFNNELAAALKDVLTEQGTQIEPLRKPAGQQASNKHKPAPQAKKTTPAAQDKSQPQPAPAKPQPAKKASPPKNIMPAPPARAKAAVEAVAQQPAKAEQIKVERTDEDLASCVQTKAQAAQSPDRAEQIKELKIKNPSLDDVAQRFRQMMKKGEGAWLDGPVVRHKDYMEVSTKSLSKIRNDHPQYGLVRLRITLIRHGFTVGSTGIRLPFNPNTKKGELNVS